MKRKELAFGTIFRYLDRGVRTPLGDRMFYTLGIDSNGRHFGQPNWEQVPAEYHRASMNPSTTFSSESRKNDEVLVLWPEPTPVFNDWGEDAL